MLLLILGALIFLFLFYDLYWKRRNYPPGPTPLPLFGNLIEIYNNCPGYGAYQKWTREYGPVHTYWMSGNLPVVAISDYETIKEHVIKDGEKFAGRWFFEDFVKDFKGGDYGIMNAYGDLWTNQRRLAVHILRDFGMGRNIMEERVMIEVDYLLERLSSQKEINVQNDMDIAVGSVINNILFGYRFDKQHQHEFEFVKDNLRKLIAYGSDSRLFIAASSPYLRPLPPFRGVYNGFLEVNKVLFDFIRKQIAVKQKQVDYDSETSEDFVESYMKEWRRKKGTPQEEFFFEKQLEAVVFDVWTAGMETTSNTLTWTIVYILNHPDVQTRIHKELDRVIRSNRKITLADKNSLPYLNAVICEVQRMANLLPQNLFRQVTEDVWVNGHKIPAKTVVVPQISCVMYDEKIFPNPDRFDPNRFLNQNGSLRVYPELVPFSVGKRQCPGEGLARAELWLFIANVFQRFEVSAEVIPSMEKGMTVIVVPKPFTCNVKDRHH